MTLHKTTFTSWECAVATKSHKSLERSHIACAVQAWSLYLKQNIGTLEKVQHRATEINAGIEILQHKERIKRLSSTSLRARTMRGHFMEVFKILKGMADLLLGYLSQVCSEEKNRFRGYLQMLANQRARLEHRAQQFHAPHSILN